MKIKIDGTDVTNWDIFYGQLSEEVKEEEQTVNKTTEDFNSRLNDSGARIPNLEELFRDFRHSVQ